LWNVVVSDLEQLPVGIDLGTTRSVIAHLDAAGRPCTVLNTEGELTTPSVVFFDPNGVIVGKEAQKAAEFEPDRVARCAKRNMGDRFYERPVCGCRLPPEVIQALVLRKLKADAELKLGAISRVVITVPAYFNEPRRKATQDAGRLVGLDVLDIINEPTAAAISFGIQQGFLNARGESSQRETVLVYDLGGGTFDVTLMDIEGERYTARATGGDVYLGGIDWDQRIADYVAEQFRDKFAFDPRDDEQAKQALLVEAEDAKHALTARSLVNIQFAHDGKRLRVPLSREQFEELTGELVDRTILTVRRLMREAQCEWSQLTRIMLVGGSTRMPAVQRAIERESGLSVDRSLSPDEAVAHGAAIYAGLLMQDRRVPRRGMSVVNVNSHDLGVLGVERETGLPRRKVLIARNTPLPAAGSSKFVTGRVGQSSVKVTVVEGGDAAGKNATLIGNCVVTDLPPGLPSGTPIKVTFNYGTNGRLTVGAVLPGTGRHASMSIERSSGLSEAEIAAWQQRIAANRIVDDAPRVAELAAELLDADSAVVETEDLPTADHDEPLEVEDFLDAATPTTESRTAPVAPRAPTPADRIAIDTGKETPPASGDAALNEFFKNLKR
jgi:molecular chaperone DnaK